MREQVPEQGGQQVRRRQRDVIEEVAGQAGLEARMGQLLDEAVEESTEE